MSLLFLTSPPDGRSASPLPGGAGADVWASPRTLLGDAATPLGNDALGRLLSDLVAHAARGRPPADRALADHCNMELAELDADDSRAFMNDIYKRLRHMIDRRGVAPAPGTSPARRRCATPSLRPRRRARPTRCPRARSPDAAGKLGDIVFVELPEVGREVTQGDDAAVVESVKAASEVYAPVSGEVVAVNQALADEPARVNIDPEGEGWFFSLRIADAAELDGLMDRAAYQTYLEGLA